MAPPRGGVAGRSSVVVTLLLAALVSQFGSALALKHSLILEEEHRRFFIISSFGLMRGGSVTVNVSAVGVWWVDGWVDDV